MAFQEKLLEQSIGNRRGILTIPEELWGEKGRIESVDETRRLWFSFRALNRGKDNGDKKPLRTVSVFLFARRPGGESYVLLRGLRAVEGANGEREIIVRVDSLKKERDGEQVFDYGEYRLADGSLLLSGSFTPEMGIQTESKEWEELGFVPTEQLPRSINVEMSAEAIMVLLQSQLKKESLDENLPIPNLVEEGLDWENL